MFSWCQNVNVYNIEKHYHIYSSQKPQNHQQNILNQSYSKLKAGSISMITSINTKQSTKNIYKKKLSLSKQLDSIQNICKKNTYFQHQYSPFKNLKFNFIHHSANLSCYSKHHFCKYSTCQEQLINQKIKHQCSINEPIYTFKNQENPQMLSQDGKQIKQIQKIHFKNKPFIQHLIHQEKQQINHLLHKKIAHQISMNSNNLSHFNYNNNSNTSNISNISNISNSKSNTNNPNPTSPDNNNDNNINNTSSDNLTQAMQKSKSIQNSVKSSKNGIYPRELVKIKNFKYQSQIDKNNFKNQRCSVITHHHRYSHSQSIHDGHNPKLQRQISIPSYPQQSLKCIQINQQNLENKNLYRYCKILDTIKGPAKQASILLSNILSRNSDLDYNVQPHKNIQNMIQKKYIYNKKFNLWQGYDHQTIFSCQNNTNSNCSLKIQQSYIEQKDSRNNFGIIKNNIIENCYYNISLAIQLNIFCLVCLKRVDFRQMSLISQQLQIYQFVQQNLKGNEIYRNILQLYQIQISNGSYILIKQAFSKNMMEYKQLLSRQQLQKFMRQFMELIKLIFKEFSKFMMFPNRLLTIQDFVVCEDVVKIHDLSVFREMNRTAYTVEEILDGVCQWGKL